MAKTIGLAQLAQKKYVLLEGLPHDLIASIGEPEDAFDAIIYGESNHGKSSFIAAFISFLIKSMNCKCEYIAYEEAHGRTIQMTMIDRYDLHNAVPNSIQITDRYTFEELDKRMSRKKSAKIWVIDSLQASGFSGPQISFLKDKYVTSRKRKILIVVSWSDPGGKKPFGAAGKWVEFYANIKMRVANLVMIPKSRYGGGAPYVIHRETAIQRLGEKEFYKLLKIKPPAKPKKEKPPNPPPIETIPVIQEAV